MVLDCPLPSDRFVGRVGTPAIMRAAVSDLQKVSSLRSHRAVDWSLSLCEASRRRVIVTMRPAVVRSIAACPWGRGMA